MTGTLVNAAAIVAGGLVGLLLGRGIPARFSDTIMKGLGLCTLLIGITGLFDGENFLITILSMVLGAVIGEALDLHGRLEGLGKTLEARFSKGLSGSMAQGFVTASLLFCVGAMAITGAIEDGLTGNSDILFAKSTMDCISAAIFASTMGFGVLLSAIPVLLLQGSIALLAAAVAPYLTPAMGEMSCVGSVLLIGLGLNIVGIGQFKVMNYVPAIFLPILLCRLL